jgi:hypothetical protein
MERKKEERREKRKEIAKGKQVPYFGPPSLRANSFS